MEKSEIIVQLQCTDFPGLQFETQHPVYLGIQKKQEVVEETRGDEQEKIFAIPIEIRKGKDENPDFFGPFVHGKSGDRFIYLVWYRKSGDTRNMFRRAKVKLSAIGWRQIDAALQDDGPLQATIHLTDKKGGPVCATLKEDHISWLS